jgi:branched-chain amino acid transport system ATP-binding protein
MLEVKQIHTFRGPAHVLHGISLSVHEHEVVCLVGRNGAGKTTIMESIMGFLPAASGQILFHGEEVTSLPVHQRALRGMAYAPEGCGIFPELTVAENLLISRWMSTKARRRLEAMADGDIEGRVFSIFPEVRDLMHRQGMNLSGGQRKMVAIARGIALAPTLLLLDEAFEGLAPIVVKRFRDAVLKIEDLGISLLIAESNLVNAARIADRLYAIDRGEIIFEGKPQQALEDENVMRALRG